MCDEALENQMSSKNVQEEVWGSPESRDLARRESSGGMECLGVWNCTFSGSEFSNFRA